MNRRSSWAVRRGPSPPAIVMLLMAICGCGGSHSESPEPVDEPQPKPVAFRNLAEEVGVQFRPDSQGQQEYFFPAIMSGGAALFDFNGDDRLDVLLLNGRSAGGDDSAKVDQGGEFVFYLQNAAGNFDDTTAQSGLKQTFYTNGCTVGDVNNDGKPDIYVTGFRGNSLYLNLDGRSFAEISAEAGLQNPRWSTSAAFLDYDRDGWLDLYVANYVEYDPSHDCIDGTGSPDFCNPAVFRRTSDRLYRNLTGQNAEHRVVFVDVTAESGIAFAQGAGLGVITADINGDSWIDIYVANDGHGNFLWINQKDGTFLEQASLLGVAYDAVGQGQGSMGLAVGDLNGDELPDLVVTNLEGESNAVYLSQAGVWRDDSFQNGMSAHSLKKTGFGTSLFDADNDGNLDLAVANGRVRRTRSATVSGEFASSPAAGDSQILHPELHRQYAEGSNVWEFRGGTFHELKNELEFSIPIGVARSLCCGDINRDGLLDLLLTNLDRPPALLINELPQSHNWIGIRVVEPDFGGRDAIGARVTITSGGKRQVCWVCGGGSYQAASPYVAHFGLGEAKECEAIEVVWPDGDVERFAASPANQLLTLKHGVGNSPDKSQR